LRFNESFRGIHQTKKIISQGTLRSRIYSIILYKVASIIEELARENNAVVVIGDIDGDDKERMERDRGRRLRHRIHQWSVARLIEPLEDRPIHVVRVSEKGSSSVDPFSRKRIDGYSPLVTALR
jgi:IS605 OrfB family transposase